jgi:hypothetical protein
MQLNIADKSYDLFESITHATLADLREMQKQSKARGATVSVADLRSYLVDDVLKSQVPFGFIDSEEKIAKLGSIIFLCRRHAGEDAVFADVDKVELADISMTFDVPDGEPAPTDGTASDQDGSAETPA